MPSYKINKKYQKVNNRSKKYEAPFTYHVLMFYASFCLVLQNLEIWITHTEAWTGFEKTEQI